MARPRMIATFQHEAVTLGEEIRNKKGQFPIVVKSNSESDGTTRFTGDDIVDCCLPPGVIMFLQKKVTVDFVRIRVLHYHDDIKMMSKYGGDFVLEHNNFEGKEFLIPRKSGGKLRISRRWMKERYTTAKEVADDLPRYIRIQSETRSDKSSGKNNIIEPNSRLTITGVSKKYLKCTGEIGTEYHFLLNRKLDCVPLNDNKVYTLQTVLNIGSASKVIQYEDEVLTKDIIFDTTHAANIETIVSGPLEILGIEHKELYVGWVQREHIQSHCVHLIPKEFSEMLTVYGAIFRSGSHKDKYIEETFAHLDDCRFVHDHMYVTPSSSNFVAVLIHPDLKGTIETEEPLPPPPPPPTIQEASKEKDPVKVPLKPPAAIKESCHLYRNVTTDDNTDDQQPVYDDPDVGTEHYKAGEVSTYENPDEDQTRFTVDEVSTYENPNEDKTRFTESKLKTAPAVPQSPALRRLQDIQESKVTQISPSFNEELVRVLKKKKHHADESLSFAQGKEDTDPIEGNTSAESQGMKPAISHPTETETNNPDYHTEMKPVVSKFGDTKPESAEMCKVQTSYCGTASPHSEKKYPPVISTTKSRMGSDNFEKPPKKVTKPKPAVPPKPPKRSEGQVSRLGVNFTQRPFMRSTSEGNQMDFGKKSTLSRSVSVIDQSHESKPMGIARSKTDEYVYKGGGSSDDDNFYEDVFPEYTNLPEPDHDGSDGLNLANKKSSGLYINKDASIDDSFGTDYMNVEEELSPKPIKYSMESKTHTAIMQKNTKDTNYCSLRGINVDEIAKSNQTSNTFYEYSVDEVYACFNICAMKPFAQICRENALDGSFWREYDFMDLKKEPFNLTDFDVQKVKKIIHNGWRPKFE